MTSYTDFIRGSSNRNNNSNYKLGNSNIINNNNGLFSENAEEREDFMTERIREYNMNGTMIIGVDTGYGNVKTARRCFPTAVSCSDKPPIFSRDYIQFDEKFYIIGEGHKGFVADKVTDEDNYILTMAAVVKELEARGMADTRNFAKIHLAVGLPLKWVQAQREEFRCYMLKNSHVTIEYKKRIYGLEIAGCTVMPQCYAAVAENLKFFQGMNLLVDIGNGTLNLMMLNNGRAMESKSWTEKLGINQCMIRIRNKVRDETGTELMSDVIENFLRLGDTDVTEPYASLMKEAAKEYVKEIFQKLKDYEYNEKLMKLYVMGGGSTIMEAFGEYDPARVTFYHDIKANAKGFEYYCYMILRHQQGRK
ncbi:MAG: ParM/StbA family protein [Lachnospiraceae bacterium]|jgi:plasmid segregation protein ParM|nr:ParM/StbA family protein [Lachnospiraceae bacterium]